MPAGKREALVLDKPFENWIGLDVYPTEIIDAIYEINMPYLESIYLDIGNATSFPFSSLKNLEYLYLYGGNLGSVDLSALKKLRTVGMSGCGLTDTSFFLLYQVTSISLSNNYDLAWIDIYGCYYLTHLYARYCNLSSYAIEEITYILVDAGQTNGRLYLDYGNSAPPNYYAQQNINILVSRGWTVYTNVQEEL